MLDPHVDPTAFDGQLDPTHLPGFDKSQQPAVELGIAHGSIVAGVLR